jgi:hypothetical protein
MRQSPLPRRAAHCHARAPQRPGHDSIGVCAKRRSNLRESSHVPPTARSSSPVADHQNSSEDEVLRAKPKARADEMG